MIKGNVFEQSIGIPKLSFSKIGLKIGTYQRVNNSQLILKLVKKNTGSVVFESRYDASKIPDNSWVYFDNEKTIDIKENTEYVIQLSSNAKSARNAVTWWFSEKNKFDSHVNGELKKGGFTFVLE